MAAVKGDNVEGEQGVSAPEEVERTEYVSLSSGA